MPTEPMTTEQLRALAAKLPHEPGCWRIRREQDNQRRMLAGVDKLPNIGCDCAWGRIQEGK